VGPEPIEIVADYANSLFTELRFGPEDPATRAQQAADHGFAAWD
jgi:hypothetical protein